MSFLRADAPNGEQIQHTPFCSRGVTNIHAQQHAASHGHYLGGHYLGRVLLSALALADLFALALADDDGL
jgi:hypothetical protein